MGQVSFGMIWALMVAAPAMAQPGLGESVYPATLEPGVTEIEARYGRLTGGPDDGGDALTFELAHHFSNRFYGALLMETAREAHEARKVEAVAAEAIVHLGRIEALGLDTALYGEYGIPRHGAHTAEAKILIEHRAGPFDSRVNLIAEKSLRSGERVEFGYAASADWRVAGDFRLGAAAFGDFGESDMYVGPIVKTELERLPGHGELEIETGYLFATGNSRKEANGQARLLLEYELHF